MTPHELMLRRIVEVSGERRLTNKTTRAISDAVIDECLALVLPAVENQWGGDVLLRKLRALKSGFDFQQSENKTGGQR